MAAPLLSLAYPRLWRPNTAPTFPVVLDRAHPLSRGLANFFLTGPSGPTDIVTPGATATNITTVAGINGPASSFASFDSVVVTSAGGPPGGVWTDFTMMATVSCASAGSYPRILCPNGGGVPILYVRPTQQFTADKSGVALIGDSNDVLTLNQLAHVALTYNITSGVWSFYFNGRPSGSGTNLLTFNNSSNLSFGNQTSNAPWQGYLSEGKLYNRVITPSEMLWLAAEPFVMLRPAARRKYFVGASVAAPTADQLFFHPVF